MTGIRSDEDFKAALSSLSVPQQRAVGWLFVEDVMALSDNPRLAKLIGHGELPTLGEDEISEHLKTATKAAIDSYTLCGHEGDWLRQAGHFVAAAAAACLASPDRVAVCPDLAWSSAMNARMARVCEGIAKGKGPDESEKDRQYEILESYLQTI